MAHSKRNTSRPVFTAHERAMAKSAWSSSSARLNRDSFLLFGSCSLCLESAVDPVACSDGDIFCRECALKNILAQKREIKRLEKAREQEDREAAESKARQDDEAQARAVKEFELTQAGFDVTGNRAGSGPDAWLSSEAKSGEKRKFSLDEDEVQRNAENDRAKARKAIEDEKSSKPSLPSFWVPSVTPTSNTKDKLHEVKKKAKTTPICPSSQENSPHPYSLHTLVTINFTEEEESKESKESKPKSKTRICPSCKKGLSNSSKAMLAKPCGHVLCKACASQFMKPSGHDPHADPADAKHANAVRCYVCDGDVTERPAKKGGDKKDKEKIRPGVVELKSDGTGFSAGGTNEVKKSGSAFQC
ncbi:zinc finger containing protein [Diaporthe helianthi]|uniref:Zinc finger containing protein n=1 Tax=Diaporthe helianthi TaxID=158607 RepID=A0A2P5HQN3_DIAHE|nr:zinc finger containing protein [Diaporthe helianthi]